MLQLLLRLLNILVIVALRLILEGCEAHILLVRSIEMAALEKCIACAKLRLQIDIEHGLPSSLFEADLVTSDFEGIGDNSILRYEPEYFAVDVLRYHP